MKYYYFSFWDQSSSFTGTGVCQVNEKDSFPTSTILNKLRSYNLIPVIGAAYSISKKDFEKQMA